MLPAMSIVAFCGQKGGTGKTTAAISVAAELLERGHRVLLVDADPQASARTWADVATEAGRSVPVVVAMGPKMHTPGQLDDLAVSYDVAVIDCPPSNGDVQRSALMVCDLAVIPCGPSAFDAWALAESVELATKAQAVRPGLQVTALITRKVVGTTIGAGARDVMSKSGVRVLRSELCARIAYQEAPAAGLGVAQYAPRDQAAFEVQSLVTEILEELDHGQKAHHRAKKAAAVRRAR
jgi:chromosome partitioning protein